MIAPVFTVPTVVTVSLVLVFGITVYLIYGVIKGYW